MKLLHEEQDFADLLAVTGRNLGIATFPRGLTTQHWRQG